MSLLVVAEEAAVDCNCSSLIEKMESLLKKKKGQLRIGDAPGVVLIVLFLFMCIGTAAFVLEEYAEGMIDDTGTVINETVTQIELAANDTVDSAGACNFENFAITEILNATTAIVINSGNYTTNAATGMLANLTSEYSKTDWYASYTYDYGGVGCNVTVDLTREVEDNVSIAGMVLTIALIGIVLSILIGLFYVFTGGGRRSGGM